jgi:predicted DNA-binding transcriptional regulator AlpA
MERFSTREAAKKLGIEQSTLSKYIQRGKVPSPETVRQGKRVSQTWTEVEIEHVRKLLPKIANGRKTRYKKKQSAVSPEQSAKTKTPARTPVPYKSRNPKKKQPPPKANG